MTYLVPFIINSIL